MSESKALIPTGGNMSLQETMQLGETLAKSGFFADAKDAAQAVVKVLAGRELGFGPIASMTGIHIVNGKPSLGANLIAAKVKGSGRYTYRIVALDSVRCELAIFENGAELQPRSLFTMDDAVTAGLTTGKNAHSWRHYPRNMLFARAMSNAARWHCPELFSGSPVYTPEELGAQVDGDGDILNVTPTTITEPTPASEPPVFDPTMPSVSNWPDLHKAAVAQLQYTHREHVKNTLKQIFNGDAEELTFVAAWGALVTHQQAKQAELPMPAGAE